MLYFKKPMNELLKLIGILESSRPALSNIAFSLKEMFH